MGGLLGKLLEKKTKLITKFNFFRRRHRNSYCKVSGASFRWSSGKNLLKWELTLSTEAEDGTINPYVIARERIFGIWATTPSQNSRISLLIAWTYMLFLRNTGFLRDFTRWTVIGLFNWKMTRKYLPKNNDMPDSNQDKQEGIVFLTFSRFHHSIIHHYIKPACC